MRDDRHVLYRLALCIAVCCNFLAVGVAKADALPPPPPFSVVQQMVSAPTGSTVLYNSGGNSSVYQNNTSNPSQKMYSKAGYVGGAAGGIAHGVKKMDTLLTDNHGATARGQLSTTTTVSGSAMNKAVGAYVGGSLAGAVLNSSHADAAATALAHGDYGSAAAHGAASFDVFRVGSGIYGLYDTYRNAAEQKANQAAQAAALAEQANAQKASAGQVFYAVLEYNGKDPGANNESGAAVIDGIWVPADSSSNRGIVPANGKPFYSYTKNLPLLQNPDGTFKSVWIQKMKPGFVPPAAKVEDFFLSQAEMTQIMLNELNNHGSALNRNTEALTALINAMTAAGHLPTSGDGVVTTVDNGGTAQTTFLTAPYTPQGSNQAQQTKFVVNKDGTVTVSTVARTDLAANTAQAPTRAEVGVTATTPDTKEAKQTAKPESPDICANNPNSLMCADMGSADYEDPVVPNHTVNLDFGPANIFNADGVCPQPLGFEVSGKGFEISYQPMCDFSRMVRPIIVLVSMLGAMGMAYAAVRSL